MDIEFFTICHSAMDDRGNLSILGIFDRIHVAKFPIHFPKWNLALRFRYRRTEIGKHKIVINIIDLDGRDLVPPLNGELDLKAIPQGYDTGTVNLIMEMHNIPINSSGRYSIDLSLDGRQERSIPLCVVKHEMPEMPDLQGPENP